MSNSNNFNDWQDGFNEAFNENDKRTKMESMLIALWAKDYQGAVSIRYNELTMEVEISDLPHPRYPWSIWLLEKFGWEVSEAKAEKLILAIALKNNYHPVKEYLDRLLKDDSIEPLAINDLSSRYFGTAKKIYDVMMRKFLIGAVARAVSPGCSVDNMLILEGKQGIGKTFFLETLCGTDWFKTSNFVSTNKDELLVLHSAWFLEWGEINTNTSKKQVEWIKNFISINNDVFRIPYGKTAQTHPRRSVLVGTTNNGDILSDATGNRRFWIIPVESEKIDIKLLKTERDRIWKRAYQDYLHGFSWKLSENEAKLNERNNQDYLLVDPFVEVIENYLENRKGDTPITNFELLSQALQLDNSKMTRSYQMQISSAMKQLGYQQERKRINGKLARIWLKV